MLGVMITCLKGGPKFLSKMLPIAKLASVFLKDQIDQTESCIQSSEVGGKVKAIICDGNKVNQSFMSLYDIVPGKPWVTTGGIYLLFDYVHLLKTFVIYGSQKKQRS